jgi:hypothetical protein
MHELQRKELTRCIKFIEALGCKYKIITDKGEEFGTLAVAFPKPLSNRAPRKHPYGTVAKWFRPMLNIDMAVGDVCVVDCGEFGPEIVRSGVCSDLSAKWGKDTYITSVMGNTVEVLRTA